MHDGKKVTCDRSVSCYTEATEWSSMDGRDAALEVFTAYCYTYFPPDLNSPYHSSQSICHYNWANQIMGKDFPSPVHFSPFPPVATYIPDPPLSLFLIYCWCWCRGGEKCRLCSAYARLVPIINLHFGLPFKTDVSVTLWNRPQPLSSRILKFIKHNHSSIAFWDQ